MADETAAPQVVVGVDHVARCTCGWESEPQDSMPVATGATHLYRVHGIYAGGHKPTMEAMGDG